MMDSLRSITTTTHLKNVTNAWSLTRRLFDQSQSLVWVNDQFNCRLYLILNGNIGEFRDTADLNSIVPEIAGRQDQSLHGLVDCSGTDCLYLGMLPFTNDPRNGTGD